MACASMLSMSKVCWRHGRGVLRASSRAARTLSAALIRRQQGKIQESLQLFQAATCLNPHNVANLKQVGRSLCVPACAARCAQLADARHRFLLGKHRAAIDVYTEAQRLGIEDWEIWHNKGLCFTYIKSYDEAVTAFQCANSIQRHDATFIQLGKVFTMQEKYKEAINVYLEALEFSPENPEILTTLGLLYLRMGDNYRAFDYLGNSLSHDPRNPKVRHALGGGMMPASAALMCRRATHALTRHQQTILAAGSIIQDHSDMDVALSKYRLAATLTPNSAQLWNNVGMCFFGKRRFLAVRAAAGVRTRACVCAHALSWRRRPLRA